MKRKVVLGLLVILMAFEFINCDNGNSNSVDEFTVIFNLDGGNIEGVTNSVNITVKSGETITNLPAPKKIDFELNGWFTHKNGIGNEFTSLTTVTSDRVVYANWRELYEVDIFIDGSMFAVQSGANGGPRSIIGNENGSLFVADSMNNRIVKINQNGQLLQFWNNESYGYVERLFYKNNLLYTLCPSTVNVLDSNLNLIYEIEVSISGGGNGACGICVDSEYNIYIMDTNDYSILKYSSQDNINYSLEKQWGKFGNDIGQFDWGYFSNLVIDSYDNIYVPDYGNKRIQKFDKNGNLILMIDGLKLFQAYLGLAIDTKNDILYVLDQYNNQIHSYTLTGNYLDTIDNKYFPNGKKMNVPSSIYYYDNNIYILDFNLALGGISNNRILKLTLH